MPLYNPGSLAHGQALATVTFSESELDAEIIDYSWDGINCEQLEVTNMQVQPTNGGTGNFGNKMFINSAYQNGGILTLTINHDFTQGVFIGNTDNGGAPYTTTFKTGPAIAQQEKFVCLANVMDYSFKGPLDGKVVTAVIKLQITDKVDQTYDDTGAVVWTTAS